MKFYNAWNFLMDHRIFQDKYEISHFSQCLDINVALIDPKTRRIEDDVKRNTHPEIWLECGDYDPEMRCHDPRLDCGADTFEEAIIKLAKLVKKHYP